MKKILLSSSMIFTLFFNSYGQTTDIGITDSYNYYDNYNGSAIEYAKYPITQTRALTPCAIISNVGGNAVTNVTVDADFNHGTLGTLGSSASTSLAALPNLDTLCGASSYIPNQLGIYTIDYTLSLTETDVDLTNNTVQQSFEVTTNLFAMDNGVRTVSIDNLNNAYELGNIFKFENADSIENIQVYIDSNTAIGAFTYGAFYETDSAGNFMYLDQTDDYIIGAGDLGTWITIPLSSPIAISASTSILATAGHYGGPDNLYIGGAQMSYLWASYLLSGTDNNWYDINTVPMIRLGVTATALSSNEVTANIDAFGELLIAPNPSSDIFNISFSQAMSGNTSLRVMNILGEVVETIELGEFFSGETISINAREWATGTYILQLVNNGISSKGMKFIKQ